MAYSTLMKTPLTLLFCIHSRQLLRHAVAIGGREKLVPWLGFLSQKVRNVVRVACRVPWVSATSAAEGVTSSTLALDGA